MEEDNISFSRQDEMAENAETDQRRFKIYISVNDTRITVTDLKLQKYLKFKYDDAYVTSFCKKYFLEENEQLKKLLRSLDDVDYTRVVIDSGNVIRQNTQIVQTAPTESLAHDQQEQRQILQNKLPANNQQENKNVPESEPEHVPTLNEKNSINRQQCKSNESPIWKHVEKVKDKSCLRCLYCQKEYKSCGNTTNMLRHLQNQHPLFFQVNKENSKQLSLKRSSENGGQLEPSEPKKIKKDLPNNKSPGIVECFNRVTSFKEGGSMSNKISNMILYMICKDMLPLSIVEYEGFQSLLKLLSPLYKSPSKKTISRKLEARYNIMKEAFIKELETRDYYCLTVDNWTDCTKLLGITVHYINNSFKMESRFISYLPLHERHTSQNLKNSMEAVFKEFKIVDEKITAMVSDGGANIKKACVDLVSKKRHIICVAHVIAHLIPNALKSLQKLTGIIDQIKNITTLIRRSIPASDMLRKLQELDGKNESNILKLKQDVPTRWTSKVDMIKRYIELEKYLHAAMNECEIPLDLINREDMKILKDTLPIMEPITLVITEISGDSYPTASMIIPIIHCLEKKIESLNPDTQVGIRLKENLQSAMKDEFKFIEQNSILSMSTILDPRYKKNAF